MSGTLLENNIPAVLSQKKKCAYTLSTCYLNPGYITPPKYHTVQENLQCSFMVAESEQSPC